MLSERTRRFYREATAAPVEAGSFTIVLDGRAMRTPAGAPFVLVSPDLAQAIAEEWSAQPDMLRPDTMPLTRLAATAIDRIAPQRQAMIDTLVGYGGSDLVCYRASGPPDLVVRQHRSWQPLLDWAADRLGAHLAVTEGVMPITQSPQALAALARAVSGLDDLALTALAVVAQASGSLVIALALTAGRIDPAAALAAAEQDADYQAERWGAVAEITERRRRLESEIADAARFLALIRHGDRPQIVDA
ncbi:MAG: ATPase [Rhodospirillales bacterium]|nr:MAG: ATPase [Rhodospirillales bacterium]